MRLRPTTLSPEAERRVRRGLSDHRLRLLERVEALVDEVDSEPLSRQLYAVAFEANEILPKRASRPKIENAYLVEQLYRAHAPGGDDLDPLVEFTVCVTEYYDILDDLVDGDVAAGREAEALVGMQTLLPLFVRRLVEFGPEAAAFWTERALAVLESAPAETGGDPTVEAYRAVVRRQSHLFGFTAGLAGIVAGAADDAVRRCERIGRRYYVYEQFLLDREQRGDGDDSWNLWEIASEETARALLAELQSDVTNLAGTLPDDRRRLVTGLVAHDIDAWLDSLD